ncbi:MAG: hypothetical protein IJT88_07740 [Kiritimatiellae bacterium]|nr:hypothetical protein [Kiritimatiellia bacterium]
MMKKLFAVFASVLVLAVVAFAAEGETVTVMGRGTGTNRTKALEDAYRDAIERAVGLYADAEQLMENQELVKDQILTHSNAYIERYDIEKETDLGRGLLEVQILAVVKKTVLTRKLEGLMPAQTFKLKQTFTHKDTTEINAKTTTIRKRDKDAAALVHNALDGVNPITQMMTVKLVGATPMAAEAKPWGGAKKKTMYYLPVRVKLDEQKYYEQFLPSLLAVFEQVALEPPKVLFFNKTKLSSRWPIAWPSREAKEYGVQPQDQEQLVFIDAVGLGNGDYQMDISSGFAWWLSATRTNDWRISLAKGVLQQQGCFHVLAITEMNGDRSIVKARHYRIPVECASVVTQWYNELAANGQITRYRAILADASGREIAAASFAFDNWALLNCAVGLSGDGFGPKDPKLNLYQFGFYVTPMVGGRARACERRVWFDIPAKELPNVQSVKIELAECPFRKT